MKVEDIKLHYHDDARSVHTLLRITSEDETAAQDMLFDNLATPMLLISHYELRIVEETVGFVPLEEQTHAVLHAWREHASGSNDETLIINCVGDPTLLDRI